MPLPSSGAAWPPKALQPITPKLAEWDAWYSGDPGKLDTAYRGQTRPVSFHRSQYRGGVVGWAARWFWGAPEAPERDRIRLHVPIAADICQASSDLLFADPPTVTADTEQANERVQSYLDDGMGDELAHTAEIVAALGGGYLRVSWDQDLLSHAFTTHVDADAAFPEFRWGRLSAVTFWWKWSEGGIVFRQLERHETQGGIGVVEHALYQGTGEDLGVRVPLTEHPRTAALAEVVNDESQVSTSSPGLAVHYVPNLMPNRLWRSDPLGVNLGRSDLDGIEPLMDALDRTYSSWMRDIELGKGRLIVPDYMLEVNGPGKGVSFDMDREVFTPLAAAPSADGQFNIQVAQFAIRVQEHKDTAQQLVEDILRSAGYSTQTFGESETGAATATETRSRDRRSALMRDRKIRAWKPAITRHVEKLLAVDRAILGGPEPGAVTVKFGESTQETPMELAGTAEALSRAGAASTRTLVQLVHPDWDDAVVDEEAQRILIETGAGPLTDPGGFGGF